MLGLGIPRRILNASWILAAETLLLDMSPGARDRDPAHALLQGSSKFRAFGDSRVKGSHNGVCHGEGEGSGPGFKVEGLGFRVA